MTRARRIFVSFVGAAALPLSFQTIASATPSARLVYLRNPGAESCPDEAAVRAAVAARLGYDPFLFSASSTLFAEIKHEKNVYTARIKLVDDSNNVRGSRELVHAGARCEEMIDTMALSISIAIDPASLTRAPGAPPEAAEPAPVPSPPVPSEPEPAPPPPAPEAPPREPPRGASPDRAVHVEAGIAPAAWLGAAPAANVGAIAFVRARLGRASIAGEARYDAPASSAAGAVTVETSYAGGSLVPCAHVAVLALCGVASAGDLHATSQRVVVSRDAHALHTLFGPRVGIEVPVAGAWSLSSHVDLLFATTRQSLAIDGVDIYDLPRVSLGLAIGASVRFFLRIPNTSRQGPFR